MATSVFKDENMISRFTKFPDKCQATVLVSEKIRFTKIPDKCQATIIGKWKNSMHEVIVNLRSFFHGWIFSLLAQPGLENARLPSLCLAFALILHFKCKSWVENFFNVKALHKHIEWPLNFFSTAGWAQVCQYQVTLKTLDQGLILLCYSLTCQISWGNYGIHS